MADKAERRSRVSEALEVHSDLVMKDLEERLKAARAQGEKLKQEAEEPAVVPVTPPVARLIDTDDELAPSLAELNAMLEKYVVDDSVVKVEIDDEALRSRQQARLVARTRREFEKRRSSPALNQARYAARHLVQQDRKRIMRQSREEEEEDDRVDDPPLCTCSFVWKSSSSSSRRRR